MVKHYGSNSKNHLPICIWPTEKSWATLIMELNIIWFRSFSSKEMVHCFIDEKSSFTITYLFLFNEIQIANCLNVSWPIMTNIKHCESVYIKREFVTVNLRSVSLRETQKQDKRKQLAFWISQLCTPSQKKLDKGSSGNQHLNLQPSWLVQSNGE